MTQEELIQLLVHNQFDELFQELRMQVREKGKQSLSERVLLLEAQYRELREDESRGTKPAAEIQVRYNGLREQLQEVIFELHQRPEAPIPLLKRKQLWLPVLLLAGALGLLFWGLSSVPYCEFELTARLTSVSVKLEDYWDLDYDLYLDQFEAFPLQGLRTNGDHFTLETMGQPFEAKLRNGKIQLSAFPLETETRLNLFADGSSILFDLAGEPIRGELEVDSAQLVLLEPLQRKDLASSQLIEFTTEPYVSMALTPSPATPFRMHGLKVGTGLDYTVQDERGNPKSTIQGGRLTACGIVDTLYEGQLLELDALLNGVLDIDQDGDVLRISLRGRASGMHIGDPDQLQSMQPTRIERLFENKQAGLVWSVFMGLLSVVGTVLGILEVVRSRRK